MRTRCSSWRLGSEMTVAEELVKPEEQLELSEEDLKEDISRILTTQNPQRDTNAVEYSAKKGRFVPVAKAGNIVLLVDIEGTILPKDSDEAKAQLEGKLDSKGPDKEEEGESVETDEVNVEAKDTEEEKTVEEDKEKEEETQDAEEGEDKQAEGGGEGGGGEEENKEEGEEGEGGEGGEEGEEGEGEEETEVAAPPAEEVPEESDHSTKTAPKKLKNQFDFCERGTITYNNPVRNLGTQTMPPPQASFSEQVTQWIIYDAYQQDFEAQQQEKEKEKKDKVPAHKSEVKRKDTHVSDSTIPSLWAVKTLERMINQNTYREIAQDYRYWEDPSDEYREEEGTLLPLWKFVYEKMKKNNVTAMSWSPRYYDLFIVAFGCFDFMKPQPEGAICLFTLKNPSFPEYICFTETGVMSVDIHTTHPHLICVGFCDGGVAVYDLQSPEKLPQYESNSVTNKHCGIVWQVQWGIDMPDGETNFFSVSADGNVYNWVLTQHGLSRTLIISLFLNCDPIHGPDGILISLTGCGTTITFHPTKQTIFLVGTEEGNIYKCSTEYISLYLTTYEAHHMPVYKVDYNKFYPDIFISCSADWRVKIWEDKRSDPLFVFDLGYAVADVEWAPYSSTVFAAVTNDGRVHVFDLNVNKYRPICVQAVVNTKRNKLTRIAFNHKLPVIIVGDDRGSITALKLSPNLRKKVKPPKKGPVHTEREWEIMKLEKLLALVQEPPTLSPAPDLPAPANV